MSFYKYDKKRFLKDIEGGAEFDFKSSGWELQKLEKQNKKKHTNYKMDVFMRLFSTQVSPIFYSLLNLPNAICFSF